MAPPSKGQGSKRPRSEGIPECMLVDMMFKDLLLWWTGMGNYEQRRVKEHLGHLVHLMEIDPRRDVIEALIPLLVPKINKSPAPWGKGSSIRDVDSPQQKTHNPKNIDAKKFLDLLKINQIEKESLKNGWNQLSNQDGIEAWKVNGCFAFVVAFFRFIVFPKWDKHIDIHLAGVVKALTTMESPTIIPMILANIFHALTKCKNGETFTLDWCNYVSSHKEKEVKINFPKGILACEEKLSVITYDEIIWNYYWFHLRI
ncbi:hypothetical protein H5410_001954 [Solanum commersonii]|uniref:Uncharacterized protein n=1 Tax=Solanum commersonii TaxID=4109 RepID=A0A9J6B097_SOLCO|nr:hypothetical protein H5410_001954 [Solanum commersonii]